MEKFLHVEKQTVTSFIPKVDKMSCCQRAKLVVGIFGWEYQFGNFNIELQMNFCPECGKALFGGL